MPKLKVYSPSEGNFFSPGPREVQVCTKHLRPSNEEDVLQALVWRRK